MLLHRTKKGLLYSFKLIENTIISLSVAHHGPASLFVSTSVPPTPTISHRFRCEDNIVHWKPSYILRSGGGKLSRSGEEILSSDRPRRHGSTPLRRNLSSVKNASQAPRRHYMNKLSTSLEFVGPGLEPTWHFPFASKAMFKHSSRSVFASHNRTLI